jgi:hypothetical protein
LLQIDLDRSFTTQQTGGADEDYEPKDDPHNGFKPGGRAKVAARSPGSSTGRPLATHAALASNRSD